MKMYLRNPEFVKEFVKVKGIKCDNENCDYTKEDVGLEDYPDYVEKPCPKCGQDLFTTKDYKTVSDIIKAIDLCGDYKIARFLLRLIKLFSRKKKYTMDGSGKMYKVQKRSK